MTNATSEVFCWSDNTVRVESGLRGKGGVGLVGRKKARNKDGPRKNNTRNVPMNISLSHKIGWAKIYFFVLRFGSPEPPQGEHCLLVFSLTLEFLLQRDKHRH